MNKPIGLQLYTVGDELAKDFDGTLKRVASVGYKEIELAAAYNKSAADLRKSFDDAGLHCRSAHYFDFQKTPAQFMDFAKELGVTYVVTSFNPPPSALASINNANPDFTAVIRAIEAMTIDDYKHSAETCNQLGQLAKERGLMYAYHNHNPEFKKIDGILPYDLLLKSTDPELVKLELDCGWMVAAGHDPVTYLKGYPDRFRLLHIKAFKPAKATTTIVGEDRPIPTELGRGKPDYRPIFAAAKEAAVEQYYVEQEPPFQDMTALEAIKADFDYLHELKD